MPSPSRATFWMDTAAAVEPLRFRRAPLLVAGCAFAVGTLLARHWQPTLTLLTASVLLVTISVVALRKSLRIAPLPVLALWAVAGCWCAQIAPSPPRQTALRAYADGLSRTVRGHVVRVRLLPAQTAATEEAKPAWQLEPGEWESETATPTESIDLAIDALEEVTPDISTMRPVQGGARITVIGGTPALHCGDTLELPLRLREPELYRDPGAWSYADQLLGEGISVQGNARAAAITRMPQATAKNSTATLRCRLYAAQTWASTRLASFVRSRPNLALPHLARLSPDDAGMLNAMLFGDRTGLRHDLRLGFERTGSFHLFVVSGMHVALLAGLLFWLLRRLRTPHLLATLITIAATAAYAALTGFGVPVQRALLMAVVFLLARALWREISILQAIGAAALAVLIADPRALAEASFQMTFLALIAAGGLAIPLAERWLLPRLHATRDLEATWLDARLPPHLAQMRVMLRLFGRALSASRIPLPKTWLRVVPALAIRLPLRLAELALVGIVVEACMAVPMAVYFHRATPFALPANLLAVPLVAILAPLAVLTFCASLISSWLAAIPSALTALALHGIGYIITSLSHARLADARVPAPAPFAIAAIVLMIAFACWAVRRANRGVLASGLAALALIPVGALWPEPPLLHPGTLEVTALDVGQGDSLLVVSPQGRTLLVDAGGPVGAASNPEAASTSATRWDVGEEVVAPYLWSRRLRRLDVVVLTHAHSDHMGGMPAILRDFHPRELWLSVSPADSADFGALLAEAARLNITIRHLHAGDTFPLDAESQPAASQPSTQVAVLAPETTYTPRPAPTNDDSLVLRLDYGQASVLLEGDAEKSSEAAMLANQRLAPVTLLKVGHHGSRTSTNPDFLAAVAPRDAVISSGRRNTFGHPRPEILQRLEAAHIKTYRTDRAGATTFLLTPDGNILAQTAAR